MISIKIDGKRQNVATSWQDVTFKGYLNYLEAGQDQTKIWSVILNMPYEKLKGASLSGALPPLLKALRFLDKPPLFDPEPKKIGQFDIPKQIELETVEKYQAVIAEMQKVVDAPIYDQNKAVATYAAIYCQPNTRHLDMEQVGYLAKQFEDYPCQEVMSAGLFFTVRLQHLRTGLKMNYLTRDIPMKRKRLDLSGLVKPLASTRLWIILRVMWAKMTKR